MASKPTSGSGSTFAAERGGLWIVVRVRPHHATSFSDHQSLTVETCRPCWPNISQRYAKLPSPGVPYPREVMRSMRGCVACGDAFITETEPLNRNRSRYDVSVPAEPRCSELRPTLGRSTRRHCQSATRVFGVPELARQPLGRAWRGVLTLVMSKSGGVSCMSIRDVRSPPSTDGKRYRTSSSSSIGIDPSDARAAVPRP